MDNANRQQTTLEIGSRRLTVDVVPIAGSSTSGCDRALVELGADRLLIKPSLRGRLTALIWVAISSAVIAAAVLALWFWPRQPWWFFWPAAALWALTLLVGAIMLLATLAL